MSIETVHRIQKALRKLPKLGRVSVMPDYFVDRFVRFESLDDLVSLMKRKSFEGGGGSVRGIKQTEIKGGNAVNIAYALGIFKANVGLTAVAEALPEETLRSTFRKFPNVTLNIIRGSAGYTIAFEFREHNHHVNVMVSDVGDLINFDGSSIPPKTLSSIKDSRIVTIVNWAANTKGNELCSRIFGLAKKNHAQTFFDPADVSGQKELLPQLKREVFDRGLVDYVSLNENEARIISNILFNHSLPHEYSEHELIHTAKILSNGTGSVIDLHTQSVTMSAKGSDVVSKKCHIVEQKTVTGAGDVWAAANIASYLANIEAEDRLTFANAAAGLYVSRESANTPSPDEVYDFMRDNKVFTVVR